MKKLLLSAVVITMACVSAFAQGSIFNNPNNKAYFGLRVGGEVTCPGSVKEGFLSVKTFKNGGGIEFGGIYNIPVVANLYIEPGLKLFYNTYSMKDEWLWVDENQKLSSVSINKFGFRIPVMLGYRFDFTSDVSVSLFTGPELEVGLSGKNCMKGFGTKESESIYGDDGGYSRVNLLWGIGAGVTCGRIYIGLGGGIGMLNMLSDSDAKFHENRVTISLGYNF